MLQPKKLYDGYGFKGRKKPLNYDEMIGRQWIVPEDFEFGPTYLHELDRVYVSPFGVVYKNNKVVTASLSEYNEANKHLPTYLKKRLLNRIIQVKGTSVVSFNSFYDNFYHFTAECLTRLFCVYEYRDTINVLVHENSPDFIDAYLEILGFKNVVRIPADALAYCDKVLLPTQTTRVHKQHPVLINKLSAQLRANAVGSETDYSDYKRIYVSRAKASYRKVSNEAALIDLLEKYGFKTINFEDFAINERIALMRQVEVVVAIHGAGLTNLIFMENNKFVIHLIHEGHHEDTFYNMAAAMGHDSVFIQGKPANEDPRGVCHDNFEVDLDKVEYYLRSL